MPYKIGCKRVQNCSVLENREKTAILKKLITCFGEELHAILRVLAQHHALLSQDPEKFTETEAKISSERLNSFFTLPNKECDENKSDAVTTESEYSDISRVRRLLMPKYR